MRAILAVLALVAASALAQPAAVLAQGESEETPGELTAEAIDRLLRALELFIGSIPQYEAPYIDENGDIIIRRKQPEGQRDLPTPDRKPEQPEPDTTTT